MRKKNKSRPAKKAVKTAKPQTRKKKAAPTVGTKAHPLVLAETPIEQAAEMESASRRSPLQFWTAIPFAMMRMMFGPRSTVAGK